MNLAQPYVFILLIPQFLIPSTIITIEHLEQQVAYGGRHGATSAAASAAGAAVLQSYLPRVDKDKGNTSDVRNYLAPLYLMRKTFAKLHFNPVLQKMTPRMYMLPNN